MPRVKGTPRWSQLVESGADMNRDGGETALHAAAEANHSGAVAALLQAGRTPTRWTTLVIPR